MTLDTFLPLLSNVTGPRHGRYKAICPAHADHHPSLSISAGERAILLRCWSGCSVRDILAALHLTMKDAFFAEETNPAVLKRARAAKRRATLEAARLGRIIDARREAEYFVRSRHGMDISEWSTADLDQELATLAKAYTILDEEARESWQFI